MTGESTAMPVVPGLADIDALDRLLGALRERDYDLVGPTVVDGVIDYGPFDSVAQLPLGWVDEQRPGRYEASLQVGPAEPAPAGGGLPVPRADPDGGRGHGSMPGRAFGFAAPATSPKRFLHPPAEVVLRAIRTATGAIEMSTPEPAGGRLALFGVRPCDLHAIAIQDRVLGGGEHPDDAYVARRKACFVVVVECQDPAQTCFCTSTESGPGVDGDDPASAVADLVLTEVAGRRFVVRALSRAGGELAESLGLPPAEPDAVMDARARVTAAGEQMAHSIDLTRVRETVLAAPSHQAWEAFGERCLACTNCTLVCPTCFCVSMTEHVDMTDGSATRSREWDSCFSLSFSYLHGGSVRTSTRSRYRQWATHKLVTWLDQFGTPGCVGCGRCITWCPAGIDIRELAESLTRWIPREVKP